MLNDAVLFYVLAIVCVFFSLAVVMSSNPIYSALSLAMTMIALSFVFFDLEAYFIGGVQLIVYAGAVIVLFTMVIMLFDLKKELNAYTKGIFTGFLKIASAGWLCGLVGGAIYMSTDAIISKQALVESAKPAVQPTASELAKVLFIDYIFAFEALGILLLVVAIGVVAVSRIKGGTHAQY